MRVLATNISAGLTATTFAAAALVGIMATGLTPSTAHAAAILDVSSEGQLRGARNVEVEGKLYNVRFLDNSCATTGLNCGDPAKYAFKNKETANLAARALFNQVLLDVMLGNSQSNPDMTVGCGNSGICVTLIPYQNEDQDRVGVPSFLKLNNEIGSGTQSFPSPPIDSAFIEGVPATGSFARAPGGSSAGRFLARAASTGPTGTNGPSSGGSDNGSGEGGPNGGDGNGGGGNGGGGGGDPAGNGNPDGNGNDDGPNASNPGPQDPIIVVFEPADPIKVPEPSTLFIFGFALLAMAAFAARQTQAATNENQTKRARR